MAKKEKEKFLSSSPSLSPFVVREEEENRKINRNCPLSRPLSSANTHRAE